MNMRCIHSVLFSTSRLPSSLMTTPTPMQLTAPTVVIDHTYHVRLEVDILQCAGQQHGLEGPSVKVLKIQQQQCLPHRPHTLDITELGREEGREGRRERVQIYQSFTNSMYLTNTLAHILTFALSLRVLAMI